MGIGEKKYYAINGLMERGIWYGISGTSFHGPTDVTPAR